MWWFSGIPNENSSVIRGAGEDVIINRTDGQTIHGVIMQEDIESLATFHVMQNHLLIISCTNKQNEFTFGFLSRKNQL